MNENAIGGTQSTVVCAYVSTVLGTAVEPELLPEDLSARIHRGLSRHEETCGPRDEWGNWEGPEKKPGAAFHRAFLDREIIAWAESAGLQRRSIWPDNSGWALCLTHDMDFVSRYARWHETGLRVRRLLRGAGTVGSTVRRLGGGLLRSLGGLRRDPWWCFEKWLDLAAGAGTPATWFVFPHNVRKPHRYDAACSYDEPVRFRGRRMKVREMIREIRAAGMEIGLHPSIHAATDSAELLDQKRQVEEAAGEEVVSVRQHCLRWDPVRTPAHHAAAGLRVDSTLGFNRGIGFRTGGCFPFCIPCPDSGAVTGLVELPLQLMDVSLFSSDGLGCRSAEEAVAACREIMDEVQFAGGVLVLNWHPNSISEEPVMAALRAILHEAKLRRPWCATVREVAAHWMAHCPVPKPVL